MIDLKILVKNGVHFGHQTSKWSPQMAQYIWGQKNQIHLIDVSKTASQLEKAAKFLENVAAEGKTILWVGTKKAAQAAIAKASALSNSPFVIHRWVGGTFTNPRQVNKSVKNLLYLEEILAKADQYSYTKKELNLFQKRLERLNKSVGGIRKLLWPIGAVVVVDVKKEHVAIKEAFSTNIPVVALVDTNSNPVGIDYVIPANDDAPRSINVLIEYLAEAASKGQIKAGERVQLEQEDNSHLFESVFETPEEEEERAKKKALSTKAVRGQIRPQNKTQNKSFVRSKVDKA